MHHMLTIPSGNAYITAATKTSPHVVFDVQIGADQRWHCANLTPDEADQLAAALVSAAREAREA